MIHNNTSLTQQTESELPTLLEPVSVYITAIAPFLAQKAILEHFQLLCCFT